MGKMSNKAYDTIKYIVMIVLPGLGTLYAGLSGFWGFPNPVEVVGTLSAIAVFGGALIGVSNVKYLNSDAPFDGELHVQLDNPEKDVYSFELFDDVGELAGKDSVTFRVKR